jgi:hypothetical protein
LIETPKLKRQHRDANTDKTELHRRFAMQALVSLGRPVGSK